MADVGLGCLIGREIRTWKRDHWQLALVSWLPLVLFAALWWTFSAGTVSDSDIGVVDLDGSALSRTLIRELDATPALRVSSRPLSVLDGRRALSNAEISALVVIPYDFQARVTKGLKPDVTAFYNGQFILIGKAVRSALLQTQTTLAARIDGSRALARGAASPQAEGLAMPIVPRVTPLYNRLLNYALFLVPAIIPSLWQIVMIIAMLNAIGREQREGTWNRWLEDGALRAFTGKMLPYVVVYSLMAVGCLVSFHVSGWPIRGSWSLIIVAQILTAVATAIMAGFLFVVVRDLPRALSLAAAYTAPSFAFLGVTFPASDMPPLALFWRSLIPVCHLMDVQVSEMTRAAGFAAVTPEIGALALYVTILPFVLLRLNPGEEAL